MTTTTALNETNLREAADWLASQDRRMARVLEHCGYPPLWAREPGFATLVHIILEQQVSLASANATFHKLKETLEGNITPATLLGLSDDTLKQAGFSRQKTHYTRLLSEAVIAGDFSFDTLPGKTDEEVRTEMTRLKGIGHWTADIYLSECLLRPDILPKGDIAMQEAFRVLTGLPKRPEHEAFVEATRHWQPWRSVGTRMLWHYYLSHMKKRES
jgi:DNA-3-methyladenine glycosylase II